jgi:hypothetical protein
MQQASLGVTTRGGPSGAPGFADVPRTSGRPASKFPPAQQLNRRARARVQSSGPSAGHSDRPRDRNRGLSRGPAERPPRPRFETRHVLLLTELANESSAMGRRRPGVRTRMQRTRPEGRRCPPQRSCAHGRRRHGARVFRDVPSRAAEIRLRTTSRSLPTQTWRVCLPQPRAWRGSPASGRASC